MVTLGNITYYVSPWYIKVILKTLIKKNCNVSLITSYNKYIYMCSYVYEFNKHKSNVCHKNTWKYTKTSKEILKIPHFN